jgi:hypothetical protein
LPQTDPYYIGSRILEARAAARAGARARAKTILRDALEHPRGRGDIEVYELLARLEAEDRRWSAVREHAERARGLRPRRGSSERKAQINLSVAELLATAYRRLASRARSAEARRDLRRRAVDAYTRLYDLAEESGHTAQRAEAEKRLGELTEDDAEPGLFGGG